MRFGYILIFLIIAAGCRNKSINSQNELNAKKLQPIGCSPASTNDKDWYSSGRKAPLLKGLEGIDFKISTSSAEAQQYFNQGMMLAYGFNHAEAARSFYEAARLDSTCAMAYWGFAYVLGPNYNAGMEDDNYERAFEAIEKAKKYSAKGTAMEKEFITAMATRYAATPPSNRFPLDSAYAIAMKKMYEKYGSNADVGAMYAEALMNLHPWNLYDKKTGTAQPWTPEIVAILNHLMKVHPLHPGAHHFYIHALEASPTPEKALASAKLLDTLVSGSGHLLHMPSHIYINTGEYHLGTLSNLNAIKADSIYSTSCHAQGAYPLAYYPHNFHFLAATATLEGNSALAWLAALQLQQHTAKDIMEQPAWGTLQHYYSIPYYVAVKLALWDTILALPRPSPKLLYPTAIWHYAKGMAYLGKKELNNAQKEMNELAVIAKDTSLQHITIWNINTTAELVNIAADLLQAGIAAMQNQSNNAIALLNKAIIAEDNLNYNEPPDWFFSVRHYLGGILLQTGQYKEAEKIYRQDLKTWKKNGWALAGLYEALKQQKKTAMALETKKMLDESWQYADRKINPYSEWRKE